MDNSQSQSQLTHLMEMKSSIDRLWTGMDSLREKQEEILQDVSKIREAVYNPDEGLYARIRALEAWKSTSSRMIWTLFTTVVGVVGALILKSVSGG